MHTRRTGHKKPSVDTNTTLTGSQSAVRLGHNTLYIFTTQWGLEEAHTKPLLDRERKNIFDTPSSDKYLKIERRDSIGDHVSARVPNAPLGW